MLSRKNIKQNSPNGGNVSKTVRQKTHELSDSESDGDIPSISTSSKRKHGEIPHEPKYQKESPNKKHRTESPNKKHQKESPNKKHKPHLATPPKVANNKKPHFTTNKLNFYLTKARGISEKYNQPGIAFNFREILLDNNDELVQSVQFSYVIDVTWLINQYPEKYRDKPILVVHGEQRKSKQILEKSGATYPNIKFCQANLPIAYGTHHTKMMILLYNNGLRIVIHTANLRHDDWDQKTQGIWMSPILPLLEKDAVDCDSPTNFKKNFLQYLAAYQVQELRDWCQVIKKYDMSSINVFLIASVPGRHTGEKKTDFGHLKLRKTLTSYLDDIDDYKSWITVAQFSSIGSLGNSENQWLCTDFLRTLTASASKQSSRVVYNELNLIFPSVENVRKSLEGYPAGACIPYSYKVHEKQPYLRRVFCQWSADRTGRSNASPHIKSYARISPDCNKIAWFLLTSANLSKAAWGSFEKQGEQLMIRSYELGVLFLPRYTVSDKFFKYEEFEENAFPMPYDLPTKKYEVNDEPWIWDIPHIKAPDRNGNKWCPPLS